MKRLVRFWVALWSDGDVWRVVGRGRRGPDGGQPAPLARLRCSSKTDDRRVP